ncbi:MAG: hypothetical protein HS128_06725 [Ideonella sp.]|nr:hypothetical protein [Ideonella sp.]MCC7456434.1 hypothetical protein [Nitrospira sp.]
MVDELIEAVARDAELPREHASLAVAAMLRFFTARLPSSLVGELHARLAEPGLAHDPRDTVGRATASEQAR